MPGEIRLMNRACCRRERSETNEQAFIPFLQNVLTSNIARKVRSNNKGLLRIITNDSEARLAGMSKSNDIVISDIDLFAR